MIKQILLWCTLFLFNMAGNAQLTAGSPDTPNPVSIRVDASKPVGDMKPFWSWFGYDEPNYTTRKDGQKLLTELTQLSPVTVYVRAHNLLTSKGNSAGPDLKWGFTDAYKEDANGNPVYNWTIVDSIIDTYIQRGIKPLMEIGFMPKDLSSKPEPYDHTWSNGGNLWTGWTYPPKDYDKCVNNSNKAIMVVLL